MNKKFELNLASATLVSIGTLIGFGIFFKADNILAINGGSTVNAVISWTIIGVLVTIGALCVGYYASSSDADGGLTGYVTEMYGKRLGFFASWYMVFIYTSIFVGLLSFYFGTYMMQFLGLKNPLFGYIISYVSIFIVYILNSKHAKLSVKLCDLATIVKVIPLVLIFILGLIMHTEITQTSSVVTTPQPFQLSFIIAPLIAMALTLDGWMAIVALKRHINEPKKNIPKILFLSVVATTIIYILYFIGIGLLMAPSEVISAGNDYIYIIFNNIFGRFGTTFILFFILVSGAGALNGFYMSGIGYLEELCATKSVPMHKKIASKNLETLLLFITGTISLTLYVIQDATPLLGDIVIEDIITLFVNILYALLFIGIFKVALRKRNYKYSILSLIALIGPLLIFLSYLLANDAAIFYLFISLLAIISGLVINKLFNQDFEF